MQERLITSPDIKNLFDAFIEGRYKNGIAEADYVNRILKPLALAVKESLSSMSEETPLPTARPESGEVIYNNYVDLLNSITLSENNLAAILYLNEMLGQITFAHLTPSQQNALQTLRATLADKVYAFLKTRVDSIFGHIDGLNVKDREKEQIRLDTILSLIRIVNLYNVQALKLGLKIIPFNLEYDHDTYYSDKKIRFSRLTRTLDNIIKPQIYTLKLSFLGRSFYSGYSVEDEERITEAYNKQTLGKNLSYITSIYSVSLDSFLPALKNIKHFRHNDHDYYGIQQDGEVIVVPDLNNVEIKNYPRFKQNFETELTSNLALTIPVDIDYRCNFGNQEQEVRLEFLQPTQISWKGKEIAGVKKLTIRSNGDIELQAENQETPVLVTQDGITSSVIAKLLLNKDEYEDEVHIDSNGAQVGIEFTGDKETLLKRFFPKLLPIQNHLEGEINLRFKSYGSTLSIAIPPQIYLTAGVYSLEVGSDTLITRDLSNKHIKGQIKPTGFSEAFRFNSLELIRKNDLADPETATVAFEIVTGDKLKTVGATFINTEKVQISGEHVDFVANRSDGLTIINTVGNLSAQFSTRIQQVTGDDADRLRDKSSIRCEIKAGELILPDVVTLDPFNLGISLSKLPSPYVPNIGFVSNGVSTNKITSYRIEGGILKLQYEVTNLQNQITQYSLEIGENTLDMKQYKADGKIASRVVYVPEHKDIYYLDNDGNYERMNKSGSVGHYVHSNLPRLFHIFSLMLSGTENYSMQAYKDVEWTNISRAHQAPTKLDESFRIIYQDLEVTGVGLDVDGIDGVDTTVVLPTLIPTAETAETQTTLDELFPSPEAQTINQKIMFTALTKLQAQVFGGLEVEGESIKFQEGSTITITLPDGYTLNISGLDIIRLDSTDNLTFQPRVDDDQNYTIPAKAELQIPDLERTNSFGFSSFEINLRDFSYQTTVIKYQIKNANNRENMEYVFGHHPKGYGNYNKKVIQILQNELPFPVDDGYFNEIPEVYTLDAMLWPSFTEDDELIKLLKEKRITQLANFIPDIRAHLGSLNWENHLYEATFEGNISVKMHGITIDLTNPRFRLNAWGWKITLPSGAFAGVSIEDRTIKSIVKSLEIHNDGDIGFSYKSKEAGSRSLRVRHIQTTENATTYFAEVDRNMKVDGEIILLDRLSHDSGLETESIQEVPSTILAEAAEPVTAGSEPVSSAVEGELGSYDDTQQLVGPVADIVITQTAVEPLINNRADNIDPERPTDHVIEEVGINQTTLSLEIFKEKNELNNVIQMILGDKFTLGEYSSLRYESNDGILTARRPTTIKAKFTFNNIEFENWEIIINRENGYITLKSLEGQYHRIHRTREGRLFIDAKSSYHTHDNDLGIAQSDEVEMIAAKLTQPQLPQYQKELVPQIVKKLKDEFGVEIGDNQDDLSTYLMPYGKGYKVGYFDGVRNLRIKSVNGQPIDGDAIAEYIEFDLEAGKVGIRGFRLVHTPNQPFEYGGGGNMVNITLTKSQSGVKVESTTIDTNFIRENLLPKKYYFYLDLGNEPSGLSGIIPDAQNSALELETFEDNGVAKVRIYYVDDKRRLPVLVIPLTEIRISEPECKINLNEIFQKDKVEDFFGKTEGIVFPDGSSLVLKFKVFEKDGKVKIFNQQLLIYSQQEESMVDWHGLKLPVTQLEIEFRKGIPVLKPDSDFLTQYEGQQGYIVYGNDLPLKTGNVRFKPATSRQFRDYSSWESILESIHFQMAVTEENLDMFPTSEPDKVKKFILNSKQKNLTVWRRMSLADIKARKLSDLRSDGSFALYATGTNHDRREGEPQLFKGVTLQAEVKTAQIMDSALVPAQPKSLEYVGLPQDFSGLIKAIKVNFTDNGVDIQSTLPPGMSITYDNSEEDNVDVNVNLIGVNPDDYGRFIMNRFPWDVLYGRIQDLKNIKLTFNKNTLRVEKIEMDFNENNTNKPLGIQEASLNKIVFEPSNIGGKIKCSCYVYKSKSSPEAKTILEDITYLNNYELFLVEIED